MTTQTKPKSKADAIREQGPALLARGYSYGDIGKLVGTSRQHVGQILGNRTQEEIATARESVVQGPSSAIERNPEGEPEVKVQISVPVSVIERMDGVRGKKNKRQYAYEALVKQIKADEAARK